MGPFHGPIVEARNAKSAPVANALREDAPGVTGLVFVLPGGLQHVQVMVWLDKPDTIGSQTHPTIPIPPFAGSFRFKCHCLLSKDLELRRIAASGSVSAPARTP